MMIMEIEGSFFLFLETVAMEDRVIHSLCVSMSIYRVFKCLGVG